MTSGLTLRFGDTRQPGLGRRLASRRAFASAAKGGVRPHATVIADRVTPCAIATGRDRRVALSWVAGLEVEGTYVPVVRHLDVKFGAGICSRGRAP